MQRAAVQVLVAISMIAIARVAAAASVDVDRTDDLPVAQQEWFAAGANSISQALYALPESSLPKQVADVTTRIVISRSGQVVSCELLMSNRDRGWEALVLKACRAGRFDTMPADMQTHASRIGFPLRFKFRQPYWSDPNVPRVRDCALAVRPVAAGDATGRVQLRVDVSAKGAVSAVEIETSSGSDALDAAAIEAYRKCGFIPAFKRGKPVDAAYSLDHYWLAPP